MARIFISSLFCLTLFSSVLSQEGEVDPFEIYTQDQNHKVLIIPFDSKMYVSSLDAQISDKTEMNYFEIRENMRFGIAEQILLAIDKKIPAVSMIHHDNDTLISDLDYVNNSIGYIYTLVPNEEIVESEEESPENLSAQVKSKLTSLVNKGVGNITVPKEKKEYEKGKIYNGEVYTTNHYAERFMNTSIHNPNLLNVLSKKYESDMYIFINELNIGKAASSPETPNEYFRKIKVHYTIFNQKGKEIDAGAATAQMPHYVSDMNQIVKKYFSEIAQDICTFVPEAQLEKNTIEKENEDSKKSKEQRKVIHGLMVE